MSQGIASILSTASDTAKMRLQAGNGEEVDSEVIQQFEALFLQQMLKSMRTASLAEGLFQSDQSEFYRDMYDQQIATDLAKQELLGIANLINRQLGRAPAHANHDIASIDMNQADASKIDLSNLTGFVNKLTNTVNEQAVNQVQDIDKVRPLAFKPETPHEFFEVAYRYAQAPAEKLGVDPKVLVAIAALETGWGDHVPHGNSGSSNNYFGIKADSRWQGEQVGSQTLEFEQGTFKELTQSFRVYDSLKESFNDYADFLLSNDRYSYALEFAHDTKRFLQEIQNAGYATDPQYANKILNVLSNKVFASE